MCDNLCDNYNVSLYETYPDSKMYEKRPLFASKPFGIDEATLKHLRSQLACRN